MRKFLLKRHRLALALLMLFAAFTQAKADDVSVSTLDGLKSAISSATAGSTITLTENITGVNEAITINKAITLNLNGKTISGTGGYYGTSTNTALLAFTANATITGNGKIEVVAESANEMYGIFANGASLTLESGTLDVTNNSTSTVKNTDGIFLGGNRTLNLQNFVVNVKAAQRVYGIYASATSKIDISGGSVSATAENQSAYGIHLRGTANISGGTVRAKATNSTAYGVWLYADSKNSTHGILNLSNDGNIKVSAPTTSVAIYVGNADTELSKATITGGTITAKATTGNADGIVSYGSVNVSGGTINSTSSGTSSYGIIADNGTATVSDSAVINSIGEEKATAGGVSAYNTAKVELMGGTISATTATESGSTALILNVAAGKDNSVPTAIISGGKYTVTGKRYAIANSLENTSQITISGGYFNVKNNIDKYINTTKAICAVVDTAYTNHGYAYQVATAVAQIGTTNYAKLVDAVDAAPTDGTQTTIKILGNIQGSGVKVEGGKNIVIDLGGYTYEVTNPTVGSKGTETNGFQLLKGSTVKFHNGTLKSSTAQILLQNYSDLTLDSVTVDGTNLAGIKYAVSNNFGSMTTTGNTTIKAASDGVAFDVYYGLSAAYDDGVKVNIGSGTTISGVVQYDKDPRVTTTDWTDKATIVVADDVDLSNITFENEGNSTVTPNVKTTSGSSLVVAKIGKEYYPSLEKAVTNAASYSTILILKAGTYSIPAIATSLTINGYNADGTVIINNVDKQTDNYQLTLSKLTFTSENALKFNAANGIYANNCTFNSPVEIDSSASYTFSYCTFNQNDDDEYSVLLNSGASFNKCTFVSKKGMAIKYNETTNTESKTTILNCAFTSDAGNTNAAVMLYVAGNSTVTSTITLSGINTVSNFAATASEIQTKADNGLWGVNATTSSTASIVKDGETYFPAPSTNVAEVDGTQYKYLGEAFDAVKDGGTVKFIADATTNLNKTLGTSGNTKSFTLDLGGQTVQIARIIANDNITITDSSEGKNGKLSFPSSSTALLRVNGNLTVENGTITSSGASPIYIGSTGNVSIKGGTISYTGTKSSTHAVSVRSGGKLSITGGLFSDNYAESYLADNYGFSETTIDGATWYEVVAQGVYYTTSESGDPVWLTGDNIEINDYNAPFYSFVVPNKLEGKTVTYTRDFQSTGNKCWFVPFDYITTENDPVTFYSIYAINAGSNSDLTSDGSWNIVVKSVDEVGDTIKANTPYIIKPKQTGKTTFTINNATLYPLGKDNSYGAISQGVVGGDTATIQGTYVLKTSSSTDYGWYTFTGTGFSYQDGTATNYVDPFRFYFVVKDKNGNISPKQAKSFQFSFSDDDVTGINNATIMNADDEVIYDLQGHRVVNPTKGIYIIGGKKVIIK